MRLSQSAEKALDEWLAAGTWHTNHDNDMDRWYRFVDQYEKDHGITIDEPVLRERIEAKLEGVSEELRAILRERITLAYSILDFLKCTGR